MTYRHRNRHIDTNLTSFNFFLEAACCGAGSGKDGSSVSILVGIDEVYGFIKGLDVEADKDRTKDLFSVAFHVGLHVGDDGRADLRRSLVNVQVFLYIGLEESLPSCRWDTWRASVPGHLEE